MKFVIAILFLCAILTAQQSTSSANAGAAGRDPQAHRGSVTHKKAAKVPEPEPLPSYEIVLTPNPDVSISLPDQFETVAEGCDGRGNPYFSVTRNDELEIAALTPKGLVSFTARKVTDVSSLLFVKAFVAPSDVYVLAVRKDSANSTTEKEEYDPVKDFVQKGVAHFYVVRFDLDGTYKSTLKLDLDIFPIKFAAFDDGNFLFTGVDKSNNGAHLFLVGSSGQLLKYLRLPDDTVARVDRVLAESGRGIDEIVGAVFASTSVHPYRGNAVFGSSSDPTHLYDIRSSGEVTMVKLKNPHKLSIGGLLQSDRNWFTYGMRSFIEIDPETGKLLGDYEPKDMTEGKDHFACAFDGKFVALRQKDGKVTLLSGTAQPAVEKSTPTADRH